MRQRIHPISDCLPRETECERERESLSLNGLLKKAVGPCPDKTVLRTSKTLCRKVASRSWRYLFLEANNIDSLKSDGHLTYLRGIYLSLDSLYIGHDNMK